MRIVAGKFKGLKLSPVGAKGSDTSLRPTSIRTRTRIFDLLTHGRHGDRISSARVLDLFAGTGSLGLEALSRGSSFACFVDSSSIACRVIRSNIGRARAADSTLLIRQDATCLGRWTSEPFDLVFADPPYGSNLAEPALNCILQSGWLAPGCIVVAEDSDIPSVPKGMAVVDHRHFGGTVITLVSHSGS